MVLMRLTKYTKTIIIVLIAFTGLLIISMVNYMLTPLEKKIKPKIAKILSTKEEVQSVSDDDQLVVVQNGQTISQDDALSSYDAVAQEDYYLDVLTTPPADLPFPTANTIVEWRDAHPERNIKIIGYYRGYVIYRATGANGQLSVWGMPPYFVLQPSGTALQPAQTIDIKGVLPDGITPYTVYDPELPKYAVDDTNFSLYQTYYEDRLNQLIVQMQTNIDKRINQFNSPKYSPSGVAETTTLYPY